VVGGVVVKAVVKAAAVVAATGSQHTANN
jgi:hypothetical protein